MQKKDYVRFSRTLNKVWVGTGVTGAGALLLTLPEEHWAGLLQAVLKTVFPDLDAGTTRVISGVLASLLLAGGTYLAQYRTAETRDVLG